MCLPRRRAEARSQRCIAHPSTPPHVFVLLICSAGVQCTIWPGDTLIDIATVVLGRRLVCAFSGAQDESVNFIRSCGTNGVFLWLFDCYPGKNANRRCWMEQSSAMAIIPMHLTLRYSLKLREIL